MNAVFLYNNKEYEIISESYYAGYKNTSLFQKIVTSETRERTFFAWKPLWIEKKFRWFSKVKVKEKLIFWRTKEFDDGWSYSFYWNDWKLRWVIDEIL